MKLNFFSIVSLGAQEIFKLLPHSFVEPSRLPGLFETVSLSLHVILLFFQGTPGLISFESIQ